MRIKMFNSTVYSPTHKVNINAVSGTLSKTCKESFFKQCQIGSQTMNALMQDKPKLGNDKEVVILQAMCIGDNRMMFELIYRDKFNELKESEEV